MLNLTKISKNILKSWWAEQSIDYFERLVGIHKEVVLHILTFKFAKNNSNSPDVELPSVTYEPNLEAALKMLEMLYDINMNQRTQRLSYETFYLPDIADMVNLQNDFYRWSQGHVSRVFEFIFSSHGNLTNFKSNFLLSFPLSKHQNFPVQRILPLQISIYV